LAANTTPASVPDNFSVLRSHRVSSEMLIACAKKYTKTKTLRNRKCDWVWVMTVPVMAGPG
jgi:hypothetical protein